ncbi:YgiT-type zinc finger protein [Candidatus Marsarchaeota archaeon]|nr:YgiT-type zinc finger protein [Candidatus Marsarchaeota archaeon]
MDVRIYRSNDGREKSSLYVREGKEFFSLGEQTKYGALITEFKKNGDVANQFRVREREVEEVLRRYLGIGTLEIEDVGDYKEIAVNASCPSCSKKLFRKLDRLKPEEINEVPIVPAWKCESCGEEFYSMSDEYMKVLVNSNRHLFDGKDLEELSVNEDAFISLLQEYIIRIFASKKIKRIRIGD